MHGVLLKSLMLERYQNWQQTRKIHLSKSSKLPENCIARFI
jgi:hypothetical protein